MDAYTNVEGQRLSFDQGEKQDSPSPSLHLQLADGSQLSYSAAADHAAESSTGSHSTSAYQPDPA